MNEKHKSAHRLILNIGIFSIIMALTFWSIFRNQDISEIGDAIQKMPKQYMIATIGLAIFFVSLEGCMIWYLLKGIGEHTTIFRCISYSFIGFFFSGITPSATGGQPMQLYYMKRDGNTLSSASVVLMTVAVIYKFVLVLIGVGIVLFWNISLKKYLEGYYGLYFLGLFLNTALVLILLLVMFSQGVIRVCFYKIEQFLIWIRVWKKTEKRKEKVEKFLLDYQGTVKFLQEHKKLITITILVTFLQRFSVFFLPYIVYLGLGLSGTAMLDVVLLQASVYIAVDMLPIPGSQGITEAMYQSIFKNIFSGPTLVISTCITRGINFYFMMLLGLAAFCIASCKSRANIK